MSFKASGKTARTLLASILCCNAARRRRKESAEAVLAQQDGPGEGGREPDLRPVRAREGVRAAVSKPVSTETTCTRARRHSLKLRKCCLGATSENFSSACYRRRTEGVRSYSRKLTFPNPNLPARAVRSEVRTERRLPRCGYQGGFHGIKSWPPAHQAGHPHLAGDPRPAGQWPGPNPHPESSTSRGACTHECTQELTPERDRRE